MSPPNDAQRRNVLQFLSEVTPSRRDFLQYATTQKQGLTVIARIARVAGEPIDDLVKFARCCDDAEVAALAVAADLGAPEKTAIAAATAAPVLDEAPVSSPDHAYAARLCGADAVVIAANLHPDRVDAIVAVAQSLHMAAVLAVAAVTDVEPALRVPRGALGLVCAAGDGVLDVRRAIELADVVPPARTLLCLPALCHIDDARVLRGRVDAVTLDRVLRETHDPAALVGELAAS